VWHVTCNEEINSEDILLEISEGMKPLRKPRGWEGYIKNYLKEI
jgi:hypothetical protein